MSELKKQIIEVSEAIKFFYFSSKKYDKKCKQISGIRQII